MIKIPIRFVLFIVMTFFGACSESSDRWEGRIFPNRDNPAIHISIGEFKTLEACRFTATDKLRAMRLAESGDYECAKNCRIEDISLLRVCEETLK